MDLHTDEPSQSHMILEELYDAVDLSKRNITAQITRDGRPIGGGAFADVVRGRWNIPHQHLDPTTGRLVTSVGETRQVAIKEIRVFDKRHSSWKKIINRLFHEIDFIKEHPEASRENLVLDVAEGMAYLHGHSPSIIHGDMKGTNILINQYGIACISDFGISMFVEDACVQTGFTTTDLSGGSTRWMAPELFQFERDDVSEDGGQDGGESKDAQQEDRPQGKTFASDMYAIGGVLLEILTGKIPYHYLKSDPSVMIEIHKRKLPRADKYGFNEDDFVWTIIKTLWSTIPSHRPSAQAIANTFHAYYLLRPREVYTQAQRPCSKVNGAFMQYDLASFIQGQLRRPDLKVWMPKLSPDGATLCCTTIEPSMVVFVGVKVSLTLSWTWTISNSTQSFAEHCVWNPSSSLVAVCLADVDTFSQSVVLLNVQAQTGTFLQLPPGYDIGKIAFNTNESLVFVLYGDGRQALTTCRLSSDYTALQPPYAWTVIPRYSGALILSRTLTHNGTYTRTDDHGHVEVTELSGVGLSTEVSQIGPHRSRCHPQSSFFISLLDPQSKIPLDHHDVLLHLSTLYHLSISPSTLFQPGFNRSQVAATKIEVYTAPKNKWYYPKYAECRGWLIFQLEYDTLGIWHYSTPRLLATITAPNSLHEDDGLAFSIHKDLATIIISYTYGGGGIGIVDICQFVLPPI